MIENREIFANVSSIQDNDRDFYLACLIFLYPLFCLSLVNNYLDSSNGEKDNKDITSSKK